MAKSQEQCEEIRANTKQRILRESILYFARYGYAGTKIGDLAKAIGIGQGSLYLYFSSKEELFREIQKVTDRSADLRNLKFLSALPMKAEAKLNQLSDYVLDRLEHEESFAAMIVLKTQMLLDAPKDIFEANMQYETQLFAQTGKIIQQGQKEGICAAGDPKMLAEYYWGVVFLYSLKKNYTPEAKMLNREELNRTVRKSIVEQK